MDDSIETEALESTDQGDAPQPRGIEQTSLEFAGRWNRLVSQTNWEKGRIICAWREALRAADAPPASHSDEAWSRRVGCVSARHVGRLRRVYERFGDVSEQYEGLYWSHFLAAVDWPDAEMWLEGALQNDWSVSGMRRQRWEALGAASGQPADEDIVAADFDEDAPGDEAAETSPIVTPSVGFVHEAADDTELLESASDDSPFESPRYQDDAENDADQPAPVRPFENLAALPADLAEAFEAFKLAILSRKVSGWQDVAREDVLAALDALKQLALAPAGN